ncbi:MAG: peptide-N-glycosidase F-related protein [Bacteroidota bacterium]
MQKLIKTSILLIACCFSAIAIKASPGDTISVQTFTFGSPQNAWFVFPSDTVRTNKILMYYTLKCNPAQNPACGEWDYQTSTYVYEHTGRLDSTLLNAPSHIINGSSPDSVSFMYQPSWKYMPRFNTQIQYTGVTSFDSTYVGNGNQPSVTPFDASQAESRTQFLWKTPQLLATGLHAGKITGLRFNLQTLGSELKNLCIRIKHTPLDSLTSTHFENSGFTIVYMNNTTFVATGWHALHFITNFNWDGIQNLLVDISFDNASTGIPTSLLAENTGQKTGITSAGTDKALFFMGTDYVNVPKQALASIDSAITVSFWAYGNPNFQPQDQSVFEAYDSLNNRVINVHLPWSNSNMYWDAGNNFTGSYDRINKLATTSEIEEQWNYWTFTKNSITGNQKIYLNGLQWHSGTALTRHMKGIEKFRIGSCLWTDNGYNYDGYIDEFAIWDTELDSATIHQWMYKDLNSLHPYSANLQLYYKFNDNALTTAADSAAGAHNATLTGLPVYTFTKGSQIVRNFQETMLRPNILFEQGVYVAHIDTLITIDSVQTDPTQIFFYSDSLNPLVCTDTMIVWPTYYNHYAYNHLGIAIDSTLVTSDSTVRLKHWYYYGPHFEVINRYELERLITPYGNGLSLGNGFTWIFDVSDYRTLLSDSVHLAAGNWQELLDLRFEFIKGIPPRDPIKIENLWCATYWYNSNTENVLTARKVKIDAVAASTRIKMRPTGHGMGDAENCAEFCAKNHKIKVDGTQRFSQLVWRADCGLNPIYPQGGTWVYSRANWCPGGAANTYDFELTPYVTPGDSTALDYDIDPYNWNGQGSAPNFQIETQLVSYGPPNFNLDAEMYEVKTPSKANLYSRMNPICNNPLVTIRNTGATPLTSLDIIYGVQGTGTVPSIYHWVGNLKFMEMADVRLEQINWNSSNGTFYASVSAPNSGSDPYPFNNTITTQYSAPPQFPNDIIIELRTNLFPAENSYTLKDDLGNIILQKNNFTANTTYKDTLHLTTGCYEFTLFDTDEDGLSFWANSDGAGYVRIRRMSDGVTIKNFNADFGLQANTQFTIGYYLNKEEITPVESVVMYPNPTSDKFTIDIVSPCVQDIEIVVFDYQGKQVLHHVEKKINEKKIQLDMSGKPSGMYFVNIRTTSGVVTKKLILQK